MYSEQMEKNSFVDALLKPGWLCYSKKTTKNPTYPPDDLILK